MEAGGKHSKAQLSSGKVMLTSTSNRKNFYHSTGTKYSFFFSPRAGMQKGYLKRQRSSLFLLAFLIWLKDSGKTQCWLIQAIGKWSAIPRLGTWGKMISGTWADACGADTRWEAMKAGSPLLFWARDLRIRKLKLGVHKSISILLGKRRSTGPKWHF